MSSSSQIIRMHASGLFSGNNWSFNKQLLKPFSMYRNLAYTRLMPAQLIRSPLQNQDQNHHQTLLELRCMTCLSVSHAMNVNVPVDSTLLIVAESISPQCNSAIEGARPC